MGSSSQVRVGFDDFATAASQLPKMKRAPRGTSGSIPSDTLLSANADGMMVETAVVSTLVNANRAWMSNVSVDTKKLLELCAALKKLGASGEEIEISLDERHVWFTFRTTKLSIFTLWVK